MALPGATPEQPAVELLIWQAENLVFWDWPNSVYPYWRAYWNREPGCFVQHDQRYEVDPEHLVVIPPYTQVNLHHGRVTRHLYFHFQISAPYHHPPERVWRFPASSWARQTAGHLAEALMEHRDTAGLSLQALALVTHAVSLIPLDYWQMPSADARLHEALMYIELHLHEPLSRDLLAERASLAPGSFARLFQQRMGQSLHQYILRRRVEAAAVHLATSDRSIKQIAHACGFCDRYHLTRVFRQLRGITPAAFRKQRETASSAG